MVPALLHGVQKQALKMGGSKLQGSGYIDRAAWLRLNLQYVTRTCFGLLGAPRKDGRSMYCHGESNNMVGPT